jgi:hypothetical protein
MITNPIDCFIILGAILVPSFFAEAEFTWTPFAQMGGVGLVLAWFMWKNEPRMRSMEAAIERNNRAMLMLLLEIQRTTPEAQKQAAALMKEGELATPLK